MRRKKALELKRDRQARLWQEEKPPLPCPRFAHPRNDNERLLNLQADIREGKASAWSAFYTLAMSVAKKYVATFAKSTPSVASLDADQRAEKAHDAVVYLCEGYLSDDSFCVTRSITGYLWLRVKAELFNRTKAESIVDYVDNDELAHVYELAHV